MPAPAFITQTAVVGGQVVPVRPPAITVASTEATEDVNDSFFDISSLQVANELGRNIFTIPPLLLAFVMKRRGFSFRQTPDNAVSALANRARLDARHVIPVAKGPNPADDSPIQFVEGPSTLKEKIDQNKIQSVIDSVEGTSVVKFTSGKTMIYFSAELNSLRPYFKMIEDVFRFFTPELKTPFEIIDEVKHKTFLEFFERGDGTVIIRPPQFNDVQNVIFSSDIDGMSASYVDTAENLLSRHSVAYGVDILGLVKPLQQFAYTDGKLLLQYGFMEAGADINPNVKNDKTEDTTLTNKNDNALFKYAEYFLRLHNANLRKGSITANFNPNVIIGKTFFDEENKKFGYITSVSKTASIGGVSTMTFELSYVRDAVFGQDAQGNELTEKIGSNIDFQKLDRLIDISNQIETKDDIIDPEPAIEAVRPLTDDDITTA